MNKIKWNRKIVMLLTLFVTLAVQLVSPCIRQVFAADTTLRCLNVWTSDNMTIYKNATDTVSHPQIMYTADNEQPVFCIDLGATAGTGDTLSDVSEADYSRLNDNQKQAIGYILGSNAQLIPPIGATNGYAGADYTDSAVQQQMKWFWSTQLMIWYFVEYYDDATVDCGGMNWDGVAATCNAGWGDLTECNRIWYVVMDKMRIPTFAVDYDTVSDADTPVYEMAWSNSSNRYEVILQHTDEASKVMAHYEEATGKLHCMVCNADGTPNDEGTYLKLYTTEHISQEDAVEVKGHKEGIRGTYNFKENIDNPQDGCQLEGKIAATPKWFKFKVYTQSLPSVSISKKDITGETELAGCTMTIISQDGNTTYDTWVSTDVPHQIVGLDTGTYILRELVPADGYTLAEDISFTYDRTSNTTQVITMYNSKTRVEILKTDAAGNLLEGAKLELCRADGSRVESFVTGAAPYVMEGLAAGDYILKEVQSPNGYTLVPDIPFTVTQENQIVRVIMQDEKTVTKFMKLGEDGKPLAGATLELYRKDTNELVDTWISNGEYHVIEGLSGVYRLHEAKAPEGYLLAGDEEVTVTADPEPQIVYMSNRRIYGNFCLKKASLQIPDKPLAGAVFSLYRIDRDSGSEEYLGDYTTDENGEIFLENLLYGIYYLKEIKANEGYHLNDELCEFEIREDGETVSKNYYNSIIEIVLPAKYEEEVDEEPEIQPQTQPQTEVKPETKTEIKAETPVTGDKQHLGLAIAILIMMCGLGIKEIVCYMRK